MRLEGKCLEPLNYQKNAKILLQQALITNSIQSNLSPRYVLLFCDAIQRVTNSKIIEFWSNFRIRRNQNPHQMNKKDIWSEISWFLRFSWNSIIGTRPDGDALSELGSHHLTIIQLHRLSNNLILFLCLPLYHSKKRRKMFENNVRNRKFLSIVTRVYTKTE